MIRQGTDGLSRGSIQEVLQPSNRAGFFHLLPLDISALDRSESLSSWLQSWFPDQVEFLKPSDWFQRGHDILGWEKETDSKLWHPKIKKSCIVWAPPPAAAYKAVEELRVARHKRQDSIHMFICPRLFTSMWRSHLQKSADIVFEVPARTPCWGMEMLEPLVVDCYFPTFQHLP